MSDQLIWGTHELIEEILKRLSQGESFDNRKLTELADQAFGGTRGQGIYTPRDAYDALETAVNKRLLEGDARAFMNASVKAFAALRSLTARLATQSDRTVEQTEFQQFSTPPAIALLAARLLDLQPGDVVLEPSAGTGSLAIWPRAMGAQVICNELNDRRRLLLIRELGFETHNLDGEIIDDVLPSEIMPSAVLMNPPFTATAGRVAQHNGKYGLRHIESALRRLKDGGRLVAIAGEGVGFKRPAFRGWWQKIAGTYNVRANFGLDGDVYRKYGTNWGVQILVIDKTGPTPGGNWQRQLSHIVWGSAETVEEAWTTLQSLPRRAPSPSRNQGIKEPSVHSCTLFGPYLAPKRRA